MQRVYRFFVMLVLVRICAPGLLHTPCVSRLFSQTIVEVHDGESRNNIPNDTGLN
jgi:hypothetical protein